MSDEQELNNVLNELDYQLTNDIIYKSNQNKLQDDKNQAHIKSKICDHLYEMLKIVINSSQTWDKDIITYENLIIKDEMEYMIIKEYRDLVKLNKESLTRQYRDQMLKDKNVLYDNRNKDKKKNKKFFKK